MGLKRRAEKQIQARRALADADADLKAALSLLTTETADAIIGEKPEELDVLLDGVKAATNVHWAAMRANGARKSDAVLRMVAQNQVILMTLVHRAYALGIRRGREDAG